MTAGCGTLEVEFQHLKCDLHQSHPPRSGETTLCGTLSEPQSHRNSSPCLSWLLCPFTGFSWTQFLVRTVRSLDIWKEQLLKYLHRFTVYTELLKRQKKEEKNTKYGQQCLVFICVLKKCPFRSRTGLKNFGAPPRSLPEYADHFPSFHTESVPMFALSKDKALPGNKAGKSASSNGKHMDIKTKALISFWNISEKPQPWRSLRA